MCNYGKGSGNYSPSMGFANQSAMTLTIDLQKWIKVTKTNHLKVLCEVRIRLGKVERKYPNKNLHEVYYDLDL